MRTLILALLLAGCGGAAPVTAGNDLDALDTRLADGANAGDPAIMAAMDDPIMVDPALAQQSNARAVRPPPRPDPGAMPPDDLGAPADTSRAADLAPTPPPRPGCPQCAAARDALTLGALAERQADRGIAACTDKLGYATVWSTRLPAALPLYPDARVAEAAGSDAAGCSLRIVSFASAAPLARVSDWFFAHAVHAGLRPEHRHDGAEHVLGGASGDAAFILYLRPRPGGGTDADLVSRGR